MRRLFVLLAVLIAAAFGAAPAAAAVHSGALAAAGMAAAHGADVGQVLAPAAAAAPAPAPVAAAPAAIDGVPAYAAAAEQYWGAVPACGAASFVVEAMVSPDPLVQPDSVAWVLPSEQEAGGCVIYLLAAYWQAPEDEAVACRLIGHEFGHLLGLWDVADSASIEAHVVNASVPDAPCDALEVTAQG